MAKQRRLTGYRRPDGSVGTRNHVAILPVDDLSNAAVEGIAALVPGTLPLPHAFGRLQFGEDLDLTFRTLIGVGANPNIASVIVVGIEPNWTNVVADGIAKTGKPVHRVSIEGLGDLRVIEQASRYAKKFLQDASELTRESVERSEIVLSTKDGESDTTTGLGSCRVTAYLVDQWVESGGTMIFGETSELTGGEHLIAERCVDDAVRARFQGFYDGYIEMIEQTGANLLGSQPTQGNIAGGLSTIEEKALGNIVKTGSVPIVGALAPAEAPTKPGLNFMDTSSAAAECVTLMTAGGGVVNLFPTGQGNVIGNPVQPVVKISANPHTTNSMADHIDVDCSDVLSRESTVEQAGEALIDLVERTINGRITASEALNHREFTLTKLYRSA
ncbi:(2R)-sulfolactate sulfo-lyase subunit beta [Tamaricihabitans halophyticus]|uniref:(2R)-sulfolactate sulfo-lyase subunit beta n=1 Tax=Tamaricihabitans halophyticus TaxID=1262583 RepID=A0A4R2Q9K6_9PSEU|nr:UxaA family hydrolase [Tamaricihabitans halophyticus]TCP44728.1 (2R)-sulfolactate sulfo-lyase subunit beta [Tamaricihabitans halophyticus]